MRVCPACRAELPDDARFCGFCGFRMAPISIVEHRRLSQTMEALEVIEEVDDGTAVPLVAKKKSTRPEGGAFAVAPTVAPTPAPAPARAPVAAPTLPSAQVSTPAPAKRKPQLLVIDESAYEDTSPTSDKAPSPDRAKLERDGARLERVGAKLERDGAPPELDDTWPSDGKGALPPPVPAEPEEIVPARVTVRPVAGTRRQAKRFPLKVEVNFSSEHNFYAGFLENLSSGGLFVATHQTVAIGEVIEISFSVPGLQDPCTAVCQVRWLRGYEPSNPDMVPGMGLKFVQLEPQARAAIELFIKHREPIFFEED